MTISLKNSMSSTYPHDLSLRTTTIFCEQSEQHTRPIAVQNIYVYSAEAFTMSLRRHAQTTHFMQGREEVVYKVPAIKYYSYGVILQHILRYCTCCCCCRYIIQLWCHCTSCQELNSRIIKKGKKIYFIKNSIRYEFNWINKWKFVRYWLIA